MRRFLIAIAAVCALALVVENASAVFLGVQIREDKAQPTAEDLTLIDPTGQGVRVFNLYARFNGPGTDPFDPSGNSVNTILSVLQDGPGLGWGLSKTNPATSMPRHQGAHYFQFPPPFGEDTAPNSGVFGIVPTLVFDTFVDLGLKDSMNGDTTFTDPKFRFVDRFGDGDDFIEGTWANINPPNLQGAAVEVSPGVFEVFLAQLTVVGLDPGAQVYTQNPPPTATSDIVGEIFEGQFTITTQNPEPEFGVTDHVITFTPDTGGACISPTITDDPDPLTICEGQMASFSVVATGDAALSFQWRKDSVEINGATADTFNIASVDANDAGAYDCVVTNACGSATSAMAALTIDLAPAITQDPAGQSVCEGDPLALSITATGTAPLSFQWRKDSVDILNETASTLNIASAVPADAGSYDCVVTNACGSTTSAAASITVGASVQIVAGPASATICAGATAMFTANATSTEVLSYQWRFNGANIPGATNDTFTITNAQPSDAGAYDVVVSTSCDSEIAGPATLAVDTAPIITQHPFGDQICDGDMVTLSVSANGAAPLTFQWRFNGVNILDETNSTLMIPAFGAADVGPYDVIVTNSCGDVTSQPAIITIKPAATITDDPDPISVCQGQMASFSVSANGPDLTFQWRKDSVNITGATNSTFNIASVAPIDAGAYDVVVDNGCDSITSAAASLTVLTIPVVTTPPTGATVCASQPADFSVIATGPGPLSFQWRLDGVNITGATDASFNIPSASEGDEGDYDVLVSNSCGSVTSAAASLVVADVPLITDQPDSQAVCLGGALALSVTASSDVPLSFQWLLDDVAIDGETSPTLTIDPVSLPDAGAYTVSITNSCGQTVSAPADVSVIICSPTLHVDADTPAANPDGASWDTAFSTLQEALSVARLSMGILEIRIADGVYTPDQGPGVTVGDRGASFVPVAGVAIRGGYAGAGAADPDQRDPSLFRTILSGDLNDDDNAVGNADNSLHVIATSSPADDGSIDGVTIQAGFADNPFPHDSGGAALIENAAMVFSHCVFIDNHSISSAGAVLVGANTEANFVSCAFHANSSGSLGGAIAVFGGDAKVTNTVLTGNTSNFGGAAYVGSFSSLTVADSTITANTASTAIGGILIQSGSRGGGASPTVVNAILWNNTDPSGATPESQISAFGSVITVSNSDVQGGWTGAGVGNIALDPLFVDADGLDNTIGTIDDDVRLGALSPAIDAGDNLEVPADVADLDEDGNTAESLPLDFAGVMRIVDGNFDTTATVDMGAHEFFANVLNVTQGTTHPSIANAIGLAVNNDAILASPGFFDAELVIDFLGKAITLNSSGALIQPVGGALTLADNSKLAAAASQPVTLRGDTNVPIGDHAEICGETFSLLNSGALVTAPASILEITAPSGSQLAGATQIGALSLLSFPNAATNTGIVTMLDGVLNAATFVNQAPTGQMFLWGSINAQTDNQSDMFVVDDTGVIGDLTNDGTITVQNGVFTVLGAISGSGAILSDGSGRGENVIPAGVTVLGDFSPGAAAKLLLSEAGARLRLGADVNIAIDDATRFDLSAAEVFTVAISGSTQRFEVMSENIGATLAGLDRNAPGRFPLGSLRVSPAAVTVELVDNHDNDTLGQAVCEALYVDTLFIAPGAQLITGACQVYYRTLDNQGSVDTPTNLIPLNACPWDINGDGEVDSIDLANLLGSWTSNDPIGDLNNDGIINGFDLGLILGAWGPCL